LLVCAFWGIASGIVGAVVVLMGVIALRPMLNACYDIKLASGAITAGGTLGILIPPSVMLIVYAAVAGHAVGELSAAALLAGRRPVLRRDRRRPGRPDGGRPARADGPGGPERPGRLGAGGADARGRSGGGGETPGARVRERRAAAGAGRGGGVREGDRARETRGRAGGDDLAPRSEQGHRGGEDPGALLPVVLGISGVLRAAAARLLLAHGRRAAGDPQGADRLRGAGRRAHRHRAGGDPLRHLHRDGVGRRRRPRRHVPGGDGALPETGLVVESRRIRHRLRAGLVLG